MAKELTRRDVLKGAAATAVGIAAAKVGAVAPDPAPNTQHGAKPERLRVGIIGCGGKGWSGMEGAAQFGDIVAICDTDAQERSKGMLEHPRAACFDDYREMLKALRGHLDAVVISTPDHHHAPATILALQAGLHVYCEKPLTRTISEARRVARLAREKKVATQMGNHSTANTPLRQAAALIRSGAFGAVREVHLWTDRAKGWWAQGVDRPTPGRAPKHVNFEQWLGPRPTRPYAQGYHPFAWRGWWDFGTGALGDMGCHIFNMPFMALDLRDPIAVQAKTSGHNRDSFPVWSIVRYEFGQRGDRGPLTVTWYDGGQLPDPSLGEGFKFGGNGVLVVCEKATVYGPSSDNNEFKLVGGGAMPEIEIEESPGHMAEFFRAATGGPPAVSNFPDYAGPLTETVLLGNLAIWADGPRLEWNARKMQVRGMPEYDELIRPTSRKGWEI